MTRSNRWQVGGVVAALLCMHGLAMAAEPKKSDSGDNDWSVDIAYDTASGNYGTVNFSSERIWTSTISIDTDNYTFSLAMPYLNTSGPVGATLRRLGKSVLVTSIVNANGNGDLEFSVTRSVLTEEDVGMDLDIKGSVKLPTASQAQGLGTGVTDSFVEVDFGKTFANFTGTATFGYAFLGNAGKVLVQGVQQNLIFKNGFSASLDGSLKLNDNFLVGATVSGQDAATAGMPDPREVKVYLGYKLNKSIKVHLYALKGLSEGSPDRGAGLSVVLTN